MKKNSLVTSNSLYNDTTDWALEAAVNILKEYCCKQETCKTCIFDGAQCEIGCPELWGTDVKEIQNNT